MFIKQGSLNMFLKYFILKQSCPRATLGQTISYYLLYYIVIREKARKRLRFIRFRV